MLNVTRKTDYEGITEAEVQVGDQIMIPVEGRVRPAFWLVKDKSRGPVPRKSGRFPWGFDFDMEDVLHYCQNDVKVTEEALKMEIQKKASDIDALKKEIKKLEKYKQYDGATAETKVFMDSFIMVRTMFIVIFGGIR